MSNKKWTSRQQKLQELLRETRNKSGLTQVELAERLGVHQSYVSKYESGERRLDILELQDVCDACDIPLISFVKKLP